MSSPRQPKPSSDYEDGLLPGPRIVCSRGDLLPTRACPVTIVCAHVRVHVCAV